MSAAGVIIAAIIAAGTTAATAAAQSSDLEEARGESRELADLQAKQQKRREEKEERFRYKQLGLQEKGMETEISLAAMQRRREDKLLAEARLTNKAEELVNTAGTQNAFRRSLLELWRI